MPAATSAPKATTRTTIVTGSERSPARARSSLTTSVISLSALASPNAPMKSSGCAVFDSSTAARNGIDLVHRVLGRPADLERDERGAPVR